MTKSLPVRVAIAGEALIDLIAEADGRFSPCLGGAVYNLARAMSRQGLGTLYLNPFSSDKLGQALMQQMVKDGVTLSQPSGVQAVTSLAVVHLNENGHPSYAFYRDGVADRQVTALQMTNDCSKHSLSLEFVCTGALALDTRDQNVYLPWLLQQKQAGLSVVLDANLRPSVMPDLPAYQRCVHAYLDIADIIKVSDEDLLALNVPGDTPLVQARHVMQSTKAKVVALTMGANGAWLLTRNGEYFAHETTRLNIIDTVGAGDSFLAGLLASLASLNTPSQSLNRVLDKLSSQQAQMTLGHAVASASLCVQERGCVPPTWSQTKQWAERHPSVQTAAV